MRKEEMEEGGGKGRKREERANFQCFQVRIWVMRLGHEIQGQDLILDAGIWAAERVL